MERVSDNWSKILITALITAVFTTIAGVAVYYFTERSPDLRYSVTETPPFLGERRNMSIYRIDVLNQGGKEVEDVVVNVYFPNANIEESKFDTPSSMVLENQTSPQVSTIKTKVLNPDEKMGLSYLVSFTNSSRVSPDVSVRAKGATGKIFEEMSRQGERLFLYLTLVLGVLAGSSSLLTAYRLLGQDSSRLFVKDQAQTFAFLCYIHGLPDEGDDALNRRTEAYFFSESDRLTMIGIMTEDENKTQRIIDCLQSVLSYYPANLSNYSKAVLMTNIAKLYLHLRNEPKSVEWMLQALETDKHLLRNRLIVDAPLKSFVTSSPSLSKAKMLIEN